MEALEPRDVPAGLPPVVTSPGTQYLIENGTLSFGGGNTFSVSDPDANGGLYTATIAVTHGVATVTPSPSNYVIVDNNNSPTVTVRGALNSITANFALDGFLKFTPAAYYSGDGAVVVSVTDPDTNAGTGTANVRVIPLPQRPTLTPPPSPPTLNPGLPSPLGLGLSPSPDQDGSEKYFVDFTAYPAGGTFSAGTALGNGTVRVAAADLPGLTFTVPRGTPVGPVSFTVAAYTTDRAAYDVTGGSITSDQGWPAQTFAANVRYAAPTVTGPAAVPDIDERGRQPFVGGTAFAIADRDDTGGTYRVSLSVGQGHFAIDATAAAAYTVTVNNPANGTTADLRGTRADLNAFLSAVGFAYVPDTFSGAASVQVSALDPDGEQGAAAAGFFVTPVAAPPTLAVATPARTSPGVPVNFFISAAVSGDTDGSERVEYVLVTDYPDGEFSVGRAGGEGSWLLFPNELTGLKFTPDASVPYGVYPLRVFAASIDTATRNGSPVVNRSEPVEQPLQLQIVPPGGGGTLPADQSIFENGSAAFSGANGNNFTLGDSNPDETVGSGTEADPYRTQPRVFNVTVDIAESGVLVASQSLSGTLDELNAYFYDIGVGYTATPYYSGVTTVAVSTNAETGGGVVRVSVKPVADPPTLTVPDPVTLQPGEVANLTLSADVPNDRDGSETVAYIDLYNYPPGTFSAGQLSPDGDGAWRLSPGDFGTVTFTPASYFGGRRTITVKAVTFDEAAEVSEHPLDTAVTTATFDLTVLTAPTIQLPSIYAVENSPVAYATFVFTSPFALADADDDGRDYTLTLSVPAGTFGVDADQALATYGVMVTTNNGPTVVLVGPLDGLRGVVDAAFVTYYPPAYLAGEVASVVGTLTDADHFTGTDERVLRIDPVAQGPDLLADTPLYTTPGGTVNLTITATPIDPDGSETVQYVELYASAPGSFNLGALDDNTGRWRVSPADLPNLTYTVDPSTPSGHYYFDVYSATLDAPYFSAEPIARLSPEAYTLIDLYVSVPPTLAVPASVDTDENAVFNFVGLPFDLQDSDDAGGEYVLTLRTAHGKLSFDETHANDVYNVLVDGNGSAAVTLRGTLTDLNGVLNGDGYRFTPDRFYNGRTDVTYGLTDPEFGVVTAISEVVVHPIADPPRVTAASPVRGAAGTPLPLDVTATPTPHSSDQVSAFAIYDYPPGTTFSDGFEAFDPDAGVLYWRFDRPDLAGVTVTVPTEGRYTLRVGAQTHDHAFYVYPDSDSAFAYTTFDVDTRVPPAVSLGNVTAAEASFGGAYYTRLAATLSDPAADPSNPYTLRLAVDHAKLSPGTSGVFGVTFTGDGTTVLTLTGTFDGLQNFLDVYGVYLAPDVYYSGEVHLTATITSPDDRASTAAAVVRVRPAAAVIDPLVVSPVAGGVGQTVPLTITVPDSPDRDGSEVTTVLVDNLPPGATLTAGTAVAGRWELTRDQLDDLGLVLPGTVPVGEYTLGVTVRVRDAATYPDLTDADGNVLTAADVQERSADLVVQVVDLNPADGRRLYVPTVTAPAPFDINEGNQAPLYYYANPPLTYDQTFHLADADFATNPNGRYTVVLGTDHGGYLGAYNLAANQPGHTVTVDGLYTPQLTLTGTLPELNAYLAAGAVYQYRDYYYSGEARITATVTDPDGLAARGAVRVRVLPVASGLDCVLVDPYLHGDADTAIPTPIEVDPTVDQDGSEEVYALVSATLPDNTSAFAAGATFSAGSQASATEWRVDEADFATLTFLPPAGFDGQIDLGVQVVVHDHADYPHFAAPKDHEDAYNFGAANALLTVATAAYPRVTVPGVQETRERGNPADPNDPRPDAAAFVGGTAVAVSDTSDSTLTATLTVRVPGRGVLTARPGDTGAVQIDGSGTERLTVRGPADQLALFFANGFDLTPTAYYSGDVIVEVQVTNGNGLSDYAGLTVKVFPVVSAADVTVNGDSPAAVRVPTGPFDLPDGFVTVSSWADHTYLGGVPPFFSDANAPEYGSVRFDLSGATPAALSGFALTTPGGLYNYGGGSWKTYSVNDPTYLQSMLDGLTLTPPTGFTGDVTLTATFQLTDYTHFTSDCTQESQQSSDMGQVVLHFYRGADVAVQSPTISEGAGGVDIGGRVTVSDDDGQPGDPYTLQLSTSLGNDAHLTIRPAGLPAGVTYEGDGTDTLTLHGTLTDLQGLLAETGRLFVTNVAPHLSGVVPLIASFGNDTTPPAFPQAVANGAVKVLPVASRLAAAADPFVAQVGVPTPVTIVIPDSDDADETAELDVTGVTGTFNRPGALQPDGVTWTFTRADLPGLEFTPDVEGPQRWSLTVRNTDRADLTPFDENGQQVVEDTATATTDLNVTVIRLSVPSLSVPENTPPGTAVGRVQVFGLPDDAAYDFVLTATGGDNFTVDADGTVRVGSLPPDFEDAVPNDFALSVDVRQYVPDGGGSSVPVVLGTAAVPVTITNVAEPPTIAGPSSLDTFEDTAIDVTGLSFTAPDVPTGPVTVTLAVTDGTLDVYGIGPGNSSVSVSGFGTGQVTFTGSVVDLNAYLAQGYGLTYVPAANVSGRETFTATVADGVNDPVTTVTDFALRPAADPVAAPQARDAEAPLNTPAAVTFAAASFQTDDTDGSEAVTLYVTDVPAGFRLNHGTDLGGGTWAVGEGDLPGLAVLPPAGFSGTITLGLYAQVKDTAVLFAPEPAESFYTTTPPTTFAVRFDYTPPSVDGVFTSFAVEDQSPGAFVDAVVSAPAAAGGSVAVTLAVTHGRLSYDPPDPRLTVAGNDSSSLTLTGPLDLVNAALTSTAGVKYAPNGNFAGTDAVTLTINDFAGPPVAVAPESFAVYPVADVDSLTPPTGADRNATRGTAAPIDLTAAFQTADTDSETVTLILGGVPADATLNRGTPLGGGEYELTAADLAGLTLTPPAGFTGAIPLTVRGRVTDTVNVPSDAGPATVSDVGDTEPATSFTLRFFDPPTISVTRTGPVGEDQSLPRPVVVKITALGDTNGDVRVTLAVTHGTLTFSGPFGLTVDNNVSPAVTITGPVDSLNFALGSQSSAQTLTYTPTPNFAGVADFTATVDDFLTTASAAVRLQVDPEADVVAAPVGTDTSGPSNRPVPVDLRGTFATADTDGSENVVLELTGLPNFVTLNHGTRAGGVYTLTAADLNGLAVLPPTGFGGTFTLTPRAVVTDRVPTLDPDADAINQRPAPGQPFTVTVTAVIPPSVSTPTIPTGTEDTPLAVTNLKVFAPSAAGGVVTLTLAVEHGTLAVVGNVDVLAVSGNNSPAVTIRGPVVAVNALLGSPGAVTFNPTANFAGGTTFRTTIDDGTSPLVASPPKAVVVLPVADPVAPPTGADVSGTAGIAIPLTVTASFTTADTDDSETVTLVLGGVPAGATLNFGTPLGGGRYALSAVDLAGLTLTPPADFVGPFTLTLSAHVSDDVVAGDQPLQSTSDAAGSFTVTVNPPPVFRFTFTGGEVDENAPAGTPVGVVGVVADGPTAETFTFTVTGTTGYDFAVAADGTIRVGTQSPDFELLNAGSVTVRADGGHGTTLTQTFPVAIRNLNERPVLHGPAVGPATEDTPLTIAGLLVGDPDGAVAVRVTLTVAHGTLSVAGSAAGNGSNAVTLTGTVDQLNAVFAAGIVYTPAGDYAGADSFGVFVDDLGNSGSGSPLTATASVPFSVIAAADLPALSVTAASGDEGDTIPLTLSAAATDADGSEAVTVVVRGLPTGYTLSAGTRTAGGDYVLTADQLAGLTVTAPQDTGGTLPLTIIATSAEASNGVTASVTRTLNLTVRNVAPVLSGLAGGTVAAGTPIAVTLGSFADPGAEPAWTATVDFGDGTAAESFATSPGSLGSRSHTYSSPGTYTVTLRVFDGTDTTTAATTVTVTPPVEVPNGPPTAADDAFRTAFGTPVVLGVLGNDRDPDGDTLTIVGFTPAAHGRVSVGDDGVPRYTPAADFSGVDVFQYTVSDGHGHTATATVAVTVDPAPAQPPTNAAPTAGDDLVATPENTAVTFDVLNNDADADADLLTVINVDSPAHGTVTLLGAQVVYTPAAGFHGTDTFTYTISDGHDHTATATATVVVREAAADVPPSPPPAAAPPSPPGVPPTEAAAVQVALASTPPATVRTNPPQPPPAQAAADAVPLVADTSSSAAAGSSGGTTGDPFMEPGEAPIGFLVLAPSEATPAPANTGRLGIDVAPAMPAAATRKPTTNSLATNQADRPPNIPLGIDPTTPAAGFGETADMPIPFLADLYEQRGPGQPAGGGKTPAAPAPEPPPDNLPDDVMSLAPVPADPPAGPAWGTLAFLGAVAVAAAPLSNMFARTPDVRRRVTLAGCPDEEEV